jgi:hypothetical protein
MDRDGNRSNYMANGLVRLPASDREYAVYGTEAYYRGPDSRLRRFTYRVDGFVSVRGGAEGGELITPPIVFDGVALVVNFTTGDGGTIGVEVQDDAGKPLPGFELAACKTLQGDEVQQRVAWNGGADLSQLAGKPVRLRFALKNADLYSLQFP